MKIIFYLLLSLSAKSQLTATIHSKIHKGPVTVTLDGSKSTDAKTYKWRQISGATVKLLTPDSMKCKINSVPAGVYKFELAATNTLGTKKDTVSITVFDQQIRPNK